METIVCAYDGSAPSVKAAEVGAEMARRYGVTLTLVYVVVPYTQPVQLPALEFIHWVEPLRKVATQMLTEAAATLADRTGVHPEFEVLEGDPATEISTFADREAAGFIVCGSRGFGAVKRLLLGSVAQKLAHLAQVPLVIVH